MQEITAAIRHADPDGCETKSFAALNATWVPAGWPRGSGLTLPYINQQRVLISVQQRFRYRHIADTAYLGDQNAQRQTAPGEIPDRIYAPCHHNGGIEPWRNSWAIPTLAADPSRQLSWLTPPKTPPLRVSAAVMDLE